MQIPNLSLAYIVAESKPLLEGSILRKVQELENGWLKLKLQTRQGSRDLIAAPDALFIAGHSMPAKQLTSGFGAFLNKQLANKRIISFEQQGFDRILAMRFEGFSLIFELFAKGNVILIDSENMILAVQRKEQWKDRTLQKGEQYKPPSSKGASPLEAENFLKKAFSQSTLDIIRVLIKEVNIAPVFAEAACMNAGIEKETKASSLSNAQIRALTDAIEQLYSVSLPKMQPLVAEKEGEEIVLPFPLPLSAVKVLLRCSSMNDCLSESYAKKFSQAENSPELEAANKRKAELEKSMQRQQAAVQLLQTKAGENAKKAELIYSNYTKLFELTQTVEQLRKEKKQEKEIMYKLNKQFPFLRKVDLKSRKLLVSFNE